MRRCSREFPCTQVGLCWWKCGVDKHRIKLGDECTISNDNPKFQEFFPLPHIDAYCENCESYEPDDGWPYEAYCPYSDGGFTRNFDCCGNFSPKKKLIEEAEKRRYPK